MPETFNPLTWVNDTSPAINAPNLNRLEQGVEVLDDRTTSLELGVTTPVTVPYATSITLNATQGALFRCVATGDLTLDAIVGGVDGQVVVFEVQAVGADRALAFTGSLAAGSPTVSIPVGEWRSRTYRYLAGASQWRRIDVDAGGSGGSSATPADGSVTNVKVATNAAISLDKTVDSSTRLALTVAERSKLATVATNATAYSAEQAQDDVAPALTGGVHTGIAFAYDDGQGRINATVTGGSVAPVPHPTDAALFSFGATTGTAPTVPGAPTIGAVTPGPGQVTVAFTPPASNGGAAITSYTATSTPGGITGTAASSPVVVSGLTNGTAYTFKVKATNSAGVGPESAASSSATPAASGAGTITPGSSTPAKWWIPFGQTPHCRVTYETGVVSGAAQVVWVASMPDVRVRTSKLETGVAAQVQDAWQAYIQDLSTGLTVADSGTVLGTANTWTATFTPVAGRRYKGWARVRATDGQWSPYSGTRFVAPTGVTRFFETYGMVGDGTTRSGTDYGASIFTGPFQTMLAATQPGDVLKSNAPGTVLTASASGTALTAATSVFTSGMVGKKVMIYGAGKKDATGDAYVHRTTISAQSGTGATLAAAVSTAVTNAKVVVDYKEYWIGKIDNDSGGPGKGGFTIDGTGCLFHSNDANFAGFHTVGITDVTYKNVHFWSKNVTTRGSGQNNNTGPFFTEGSVAMGHRFLGCYAEHCRDAGFLFYNGVTDCHVVDCVVDHSMADPFHVTGTASDIQFIRPLSVWVGDDICANIGYRADGDAARPQRITWESPRMLGQDWGRGLSFGGVKDALITDVTFDGGAMASFLIGSDGDQANTEHVQVRRFTITNPHQLVGAHPTYSQGGGTTSVIADDPWLKLLNAGSVVRQRDILIEDGTVTDGKYIQLLSYDGGQFEDGTIIIRGVTMNGAVNPGTNWLDQNIYPNHIDMRGVTVPAGSTPASAPTGANS